MIIVSKGHDGAELVSDPSTNRLGFVQTCHHGPDNIRIKMIVNAQHRILNRERLEDLDGVNLIDRARDQQVVPDRPAA